jgi:hypothetical protein
MGDLLARADGVALALSNDCSYHGKQLLEQYTQLLHYSYGS